MKVFCVHLKEVVSVVRVAAKRVGNRVIFQYSCPCGRVHEKELSVTQYMRTFEGGQDE